MKKFYSLLFSFFVLHSFSQKKNCGTSELHEHLKSADSSYNENYNRAEQILYDAAVNSTNKNRLSANTVYYIPVVVHIIHTGEAIGTSLNPSDAQVQNYILSLNRAFSATYPGNPTTSNGGVDIGIQFVLARRTPDCNITNGINRVNASSNSNYVTNGVAWNGPGVDPTDLADMAFWDNRDYVNLWLVNSITGSVTGFASYPYLGYMTIRN